MRLPVCLDAAGRELVRASVRMVGFVCDVALLRGGPVAEERRAVALEGEVWDSISA